MTCGELFAVLNTKLANAPGIKTELEPATSWRTRIEKLRDDRSLGSLEDAADTVGLVVGLYSRTNRTSRAWSPDAVGNVNGLYTTSSSFDVRSY